MALTDTDILIYQVKDGSYRAFVRGFGTLYNAWGINRSDALRKLLRVLAVSDVAFDFSDEFARKLN